MNSKLGLLAALGYTIGMIPVYSEAAYIGVFLTLMLIAFIVIRTLEDYYTLKATWRYTERQRLIDKMRRAAPFRHDIGIIFLCCLIAVSGYIFLAWLLAGIWIAKLVFLAYARKVGV